MSKRWDIRPRAARPGALKSAEGMGADYARHISSNVRPDSERMTTSLKEKVMKGAIAGTIAGVASSALFGESGSTTLLGIDMPIPVAIGVANGAASVAADFAHDYIFPHIPGNQKYTTIESTLLGVGVAGGATTWLLNKENLSLGTAMNGFALGAGSYVAADYIDSKIGGSSDLMLF